MSVRHVTIGLLLVVVLALVGWDVYAYLAVPEGAATISDVVLTFAMQHPVLPFVLGVVSGHLLWPQRVKE